MRIEVYKGVIFIDGEIPFERKVCIFDEESTGLNNQLKTIDQLKDKIIANLSGSCNAIINYEFGQRQKILGFDDVTFFGKGSGIVLSKQQYDEYLQFAGYEINDQGVVQKKFKNISIVTNTDFDFSQQVLILKKALYKYKDYYLIQVKLFNNGMLPIEAVKMHITAYDSFHEPIICEEPFVLNHLSIQVNETFGDTKCYECKLHDVAAYDIEVVKVCDNEGTVYDCQSGALTHLDQQKCFLEIYDKDIQQTLTKGIKFKHKKLAYLPDFGDKYWRCACGNLNKASSMQCTCEIKKEDCKSLTNTEATKELSVKIKEKYGSS